MWPKLLCLFSCLWLVGNACSRPLHVAVASNFHQPAIVLAEQFTQNTGIEVSLIPGASGVLYAQIQQGAPFDVFLSADMAYPEKLYKQGLASAVATYARGQLVLWHPVPTGNTLVIADPALAPYGHAAMEIKAHHPKHTQLVFAQNINHAFTLIDTGHADNGYVSLSHLLLMQSRSQDERYHAYSIVNTRLYTPLDQGATIIAQSENTKVARKFLNYLQAPAQQQYLTRIGYAKR